MENRKAFSVQTVADFDLFLAELVPALQKARTWPVTKGHLVDLVRLNKAALPYNRPRVMYVVDGPDRVGWEEDNGSGTRVILMIPK